MSQSAIPDSELARLIVAATEGELSEADHSKMAEILRIDPAARDQYVAHMLLHGRLKFNGEELLAHVPAEQISSAGPPQDLSPPVLALFPQEPSEGRECTPAASPVGSSTLPQAQQRRPAVRWRPVVGWRALVSVAVMAVIIGVASAKVWLLLNEDPRQMAAVQQPVAAAPVAYLAVSNGCHWGDGERSPWSVGRSVRSGDEITLYEGIAEFRLASGIALSIEGPAEIVLASPTSVVVQRGKLTAQVPWTVADCRVVVGDYRLSAGEAEFGVNVRESTIDVHVFSGEVAVERLPLSSKSNTDIRREPSAEVDDFRPMVIASQQSLAITKADGIATDLSWGQADETQFATKLPMAGRLPVSQRYIDSVLASGPVGYWRFESFDQRGVACETGRASELEVVGHLRLAGDPGNHVAEFGRPDAEGLLISTRPLEDLSSKHEYSVELWIKPSHVHWGGLVALLSDPATKQEGHAFYLELEGSADDVFRPFPWNRPPGTVRFLHRDPPSEHLHKGTACFSTNPYVVRRWQHVVAVKTGSQMQLYLDGRLVGSEQDDTPLASDLYLLVGRCRTPQRASMVGKRLPSLPFVGQLDELAIYDRALGEQEVAEHYQVVRRMLDHDEGPIPQSGI